MDRAALIRLQPSGPWRYGPGEGGAQRLDAWYRSDRLYSAVTLALQQLGHLDEWLDATARAATPAATFSSLFPYQADTLFVPPPATLWPPPPALLTSPSPVFLAKMRWEAVQFISLGLVDSLATGQTVLADQWVIDPESGCLLRRDRPRESPFRTLTRTRAAVDRVTGISAEADHIACLEFESTSGLWTVVRFASGDAEQLWTPRLQAAFRLLADTGFGGGRGSGFGQSAEPEWQAGDWPRLLLPRVANQTQWSSQYWLLSLYAPASSDEVNWKTGEYRLTVRGGRVESRNGSGAAKKTVRMVAEGSVLSLHSDPVGMAPDVAPEGFPHPVYRSGFALALRLPVPRQTPIEPVEATPPESSLEAARDEAAELASGMQSDLADEAEPVLDKAEKPVLENAEKPVLDNPEEPAAVAEPAVPEPVASDKPDVVDTAATEEAPIDSNETTSPESEGSDHEL